MEIEMTPQEQANHPDWIVRCYGPEMAEMMNKLRTDHEAVMRRDNRRHLIQLAIYVPFWLLQVAGITIITYRLAEWLHEIC